MAEVYRRRNKRAEAIQELQAALEQRDSAVDRTTLARIYLEQKKPDLANAELERALKIAPNYTEARQLLEHLQNGKPQAAHTMKLSAQRAYRPQSRNCFRTCRDSVSVLGVLPLRSGRRRTPLLNRW